MPPQAYALVATFAVLSLVVGAAVTSLVGPRLARAAVLPTLAAFGAFYLVGHRLGWAFGPEITLYGFQVAIVSDVAVAAVAAAATAVAQRTMVRVVAGGQAR